MAKPTKRVPPMHEEGSGIRLQKYLAHAGVCSRRRAEKLILEGRVSVDGILVQKLGTKVIPGHNEVRVDNKIVIIEDDYEYFVLNKPRGYLTTLFDPHGRPTIETFLKDVKSRVYPVGRLDKDSEGLLLLTNHGELSHRLLHPRFKVPKKYIVTVKGSPPEGLKDRFKKGIEIAPGTVAKASDVRLIAQKGPKFIYEIVLRQGIKRQIRYMFRAVGNRVEKLKRVEMGPITLGDLKPGEIRRLSLKEVQLLKDAVGIK